MERKRPRAAEAYESSADYDRGTAGEPVSRPVRQLRPMGTPELKATAVLWMEIEEATAKVRPARPGDADEADLPVWTGLLPV